MPDNIAAPPAAAAVEAAPQTGDAQKITPKVETATTAPVVDEKKNSERRAAAIAEARRKEISLRQAEEKLKSEKRDFELERLKLSQAQEKSLQYEKLSQLAQKDPIELMKAYGITEDQLLRRIAAGDSRTPEQIAQQAVDRAFSERQAKYHEEVQKQERERQNQQVAIQKRAQENEIANMKKAIETNPEKYEFCSTRPDSTDQAWKVMTEYYIETRDNGRAEILPFEEALDIVEAQLEAQFESFLTSSKKLAAKKTLAEEEAKKKLVDDAAIKAKSVEADGFKSLNGLPVMFKDRKTQKKPAPVKAAPNNFRTKRALADKLANEFKKGLETQGK